MASPLVATATDPTLTPTITTPDDGDTVDAASVHPGFQGLLNFVAYLRNALASLLDGGSASFPSTSIEAGSLSSLSDISATGIVTGGTRLRSGGDLLVTNDGAIGGIVSAGLGFTTPGTLDVSENGHFGSDLAIDGRLTASVISAPTLSGTQTGKHVNGRILGPNTNATFQMATYDLISIPDSTILTGDVDWTIGTIGAADGMSIAFQNLDTTHKVTIHGIPAYDPGGGYVMRNVSAGTLRLEVSRMGGVLYATAIEVRA